MTILGNDFVNPSRCMFGDAEAIQTNFWGPKTLLCILPPSLVPGTVPVTIKDVESTKTNMFTYRDGNCSHFFLIFIRIRSTYHGTRSSR